MIEGILRFEIKPVWNAGILTRAFHGVLFGALIG
jgi:hypothetical protein